MKNFEPVCFETEIGGNMNESLKLTKKVKDEPSSKTGFKRRPDHEAGNSFSSRNQQSLDY